MGWIPTHTSGIYTRASHGENAPAVGTISMSSGPNAPNRVLQELVPELALVLATIFQQLIDIGEPSEEWGKANIAPVFAKGD